MTRGVYRCDISMSPLGEYLKDRYTWLSDQMRERIGNPPTDVIYPVWAWYQWEGKRKKPDLRRERWCNGFKGDRFACFEIDIPDEKVVLSDFDAWSIILLNGLISNTEEEDTMLTKQYEASKDKEGFKQHNWERVFDISPFKNEWITRGDSIQATFWELKKEYIVDVNFFESAVKQIV